MLIRNVQVAQNFFHHSFIIIIMLPFCIGNPNCNRASTCMPSGLLAWLTTRRKNEYGSLQQKCQRYTTVLTTKFSRFWAVSGEQKWKKKTSSECTMEGRGTNKNLQSMTGFKPMTSKTSSECSNH